MYKFLIIAALFLCISAFGQNDSCYQTFLSAGIAAYDNLRFEESVQQFKAARLCADRPDNNEANLWLEKAQSGYLDHTLEALRVADSLRLTLEETNQNLREALASKLNPLNQIALLLRELKFKYDLGKEIDEVRSVIHGNLSWNLILGEDYDGAVVAAQRGLRLNQDNHWINANLAIAFALKGDMDKARSIALKSRDLPHNEVTVKNVILGDIEKLRQYGIQSVDLEQIKQLLSE